MSTIEAPSYVPQTATDGGWRPRRILLGMMVAVFFSGGVIGSGSTLMVINRRIKENEKGPCDPEKARVKIVSELEEKLSLNEEQTAQVDQIMMKHLSALDRLRREFYVERVREQFKQMEDQVNSVLNEEQSVQWHAWLEERRKRVCPSNGRGQKAGSAKQTDTTGKSDVKSERGGKPQAATGPDSPSLPRYLLRRFGVTFVGRGTRTLIA